MGAKKRQKAPPISGLRGGVEVQSAKQILDDAAIEGLRQKSAHDAGMCFTEDQAYEARDGMFHPYRATVRIRFFGVGKNAVFAAVNRLLSTAKTAKWSPKIRRQKAPKSATLQTRLEE